MEGYDVRVGDTLRAIGVLEEWSWKEGVVRQMVVSPNAGGSIQVVAPEEQYIHAQQVDHLHKTLYSHPFEMPDPKPPKTTTSLRDSTTSPGDAQNVERPSSPGWHPKSDSTVLTLDDSASNPNPNPRSTSWPVLVLGNSPKPKLRHPSRLPPASLTRPTFRRYILHTVISHVQSALEVLLTPEHQEGRDFEEGDDAGEMDGGKEGIERLRKALGYYFPEYRELNQTLQRDRPQPQPRPGPDPDPDPRRKRKRPRTAKETVGPLIPFTPASLLADPTISLLGGLILEREARARVKRLKRDFLSNSDSYSQSQTQSIQEEYTSRRHLYKQTSSFLTPPEKERGVRRMITTALREMAEAGEIVQVRLETAFTPFLSARAHPDSDNAGDTSAYLPLPPPLLFPLLFPLFLSLQSQSQARSQARSQRRTNPHHARPPAPQPPPTATTTTTLTKTLTQWGKDGRWERVTSEIVQAGMYWAQERGWVDKAGEGWVLGDEYDWV
ncbi:hypothetical protein J001_05221 [Cryptococcus neoformans]|nr:hypothetical protein J004_05278 [Cryptococcus neoformans var. grubii]OXH49548.1 hypothetical protein J002_05194 [Cryptococcus neoformans var. grubii]OXH66160.1 hypothetical protein J001_05221 [Cryptococcus neoformans var. grubii]